MIKEIQIKKGNIFPCGNYLISIGISTETDIAIFSKSTGEVCKFKNIRKGGKLHKIKRKFSKYLVSGEAFYFAYMYENTVKELVSELKK